EQREDDLLALLHREVAATGDRERAVRVEAVVLVRRVGDHAVVVVAGVAHAVAVVIRLVVVGDEPAVVDVVEHAIVVDVGVAGVADPVAVGVLLVRVGDRRAVVARVGDVVVVVVDVAARLVGRQH